jgi:hypothetical protein
MLPCLAAPDMTHFGSVDRVLPLQSRMRVIDEQSDRGHILLTHLSFEDFLEALCRCSVMKAWPTPEEIEAAGTGNAGEHLIQLKHEDPEEFDTLLTKRAIPWGADPILPIEVCVENMCSVLISTCLKLQGKGKLAFRPLLTEKEVTTALKAQAGTGR